MKLDKAAITILVNKDVTEIQLHDKLSGITFATIELTSEQFCDALGRLAYTPCKIDVQGTHLLNKEMVVDKLEFPFESKSYTNRSELAKIESKKYIPEGWESDGYFNSQDSFFKKDGKDYARVTIRKWQ